MGLLEAVLTLLTFAFCAWAGVVWKGVKEVNRFYHLQANSLARLETRVEDMSKHIAAIREIVNHGILPVARERIENLDARLKKVEINQDK